ncbi:MAG: ferrous iron transport protein B [Desulfovibrio sp.]
MNSSLLVALAGQPNCGKSTVFNMLTGARQHVANYPGVTVEKKSGQFSIGETDVELVDLPGTYSLTSYSLEERVARDFLLHDRPQVVIDVIDASNVKRHLYLTLQLLEMEIPMVVDLNMMDVAKRRNISIDHEALSAQLGVAVVPTIGRSMEGGTLLKKEVLASLPSDVNAGAAGLTKKAYQTHYGHLEPCIERVAEKVASDGRSLACFPVRWFAIKLLEGDAEAVVLLKRVHSDAAGVIHFAREQAESFKSEMNIDAQRHVAYCRHRAAETLFKTCVSTEEQTKRTTTDKVDGIICHKILGPLFLVAVLFTLYQISIVFGNWLALQVWPVWGALESFASKVLPQSGFLVDPLVRSLGMWTVKSVTAILNYLPIFFLLFSLVAILEDSGYMPRMAFILDRIFRRFGLHGQSTLPLILGGVYVGGCAIPAVMATKAIPDERARLSTILIVPMMNCLAKVPLYLIMIGAFFPHQAGAAMFFISTVTILMALPVAKLLSLTLLKDKESAPFIMEMPAYHLPALNSVARRAFERIWLFLKKIVTVVVAVAVVVFVLINFPGLGSERLGHYQERQQAVVGKFMKAVEKTSFKGELTRDDVTPLVLFGERLRNAKRGVKDKEKSAEINALFKQENPVYYSIVKRMGKDGKKLNKALKGVIRERKAMRREMQAERFEGSFLGMAGRSLEPITQFAGFNWKINIALLSAFAAKENSAATLGAIYGLGEENVSVAESVKTGADGFTPLHALSLMLFMALYPPCVPTSIMVRMQSNSTKLMLFSIGYQTLLGLGVASLVFTGGTLLGLTGFDAMWVFYGICIVMTLVMGLIPHREYGKDTNKKSGAKIKQCPEGGSR